MSKMNLELGGKYTAGQAFSKAQADLKKFGKDTKDIGHIGTAAIDAITGKIDGPLKDSMSAASGMIKGLASGGLWGIVSAAAGAAISFIVTKWNEAKEAAKQFSEYMSTKMVEKIKGINKEFEGTKGAIKDAQKAAEDALGVLNGAAAAELSNKVYQIHTQAMQQVTDGMTEKGKAVIAAQEKLDIALLKQGEMAALNAREIERLNKNIDDSIQTLKDADQAQRDAWHAYATVANMNASVVGWQTLWQEKLDKLQSDYEAGLIKYSDYQKQSAEIIKKKTEHEKENSAVLQAVNNAYAEYEKAQANVTTASNELKAARNALAKAEFKRTESENALKTSVDDAKKARDDANAALKEEAKATREAAEKKREQMAKEQEEAEIAEIKKNLNGEDVEITKLCLEYKYDEAQYIKYYNQLRLEGIDEEEAYQRVMEKLNERKDAEAYITEVCKKYKVKEADYIKRYNELIGKGLEETDAYAELQKQLNEELKKRKEAEEKATKATEDSTSGEKGKGKGTALNVTLSASVMDDIGEKVEDKLSFKDWQRKMRDEQRKVRDQKNNMKIDQAKMTKALKGEMPEEEAKQWMEYAKKKYTPDQMRELGKLAMNKELLSKSEQKRQLTAVEKMAQTIQQSLTIK